MIEDYLWIGRHSTRWVRLERARSAVGPDEEERLGSERLLHTIESRESRVIGSRAERNKG